MTLETARMRDHWWWRPGWSQGRSFYTWHLTFDQQLDVHRFAAEYRAVLAPLAGLDPVPDRWLHLTTQGIGFVGEIDPGTVGAVSTAATGRLADLPAFTLTLSAPIVDPEALLVPVQPAEPVRAVRDAIRAAIGDVLPEVPEAADGFMPHVSLAYSNGDGPQEPFAEVIAAANIEPAEARITHAALIEINRDNRMYEWKTVAEVPLG